MNTFKITTDNQARFTKPTKEEVRIVSNSLVKVVDVSVDQLASMMKLGYSWSAGVFNGTRSNANWVQQQAFALDFDSGVTPEEITSRFIKFGIEPNIIYPSFSDTPELRKFRVVLVLDSVISDIKTRDYIQKGLMKLIGDADPSCKDAARLYFGGTNSMIFNNDLVSTSKMMEVIDCQVIGDDSGKTRKLSQTHISYKDNITNEGLGQNEEIRNFNFEKLASEVKLFRTFMEGKWLTHPELFGLATNLHWIRGGVKIMKDTMNKSNSNGTANYSPNNFAILTYVKHKKYQPQRLNNFSPYSSDHEHQNCITAVKHIRGHVQLLEPIKRMTIQTADTKMKDYFQTALENDDTKIYIIKVPTGLGKTKMLEDVKATIALPTNALKDEVYERMNVEKVKTPTMPSFKNKSIENKINYLFSIGLNKKANSLLNDVAANKKNKYYDCDIVAARDFIAELRHSYKAEGCSVLTTHIRAIHSEFTSNVVVFDEDPLQSLLSQKSFNLGDLLKLPDTKEYKKILDVLMAMNKDVLLPSPKFSVDIEKLMQDAETNDVSTNLIDFLNSDFVIRDFTNSNTFNYITKYNLPENKKIFILSASVSPEMYKILYGNRVEVLDITDVELSGKHIQNTKYSMSRTSMKNIGAGIEDMINTDLPTITFKEFSQSIKNGVTDMYFGNTAGYDTLKGSSINVVGTPHLHNSVYMLYASVMGYTPKPNDLMKEEMSFSEIEYNGFKFHFQTYEHPLLSTIQLSLIEGELIQAVGRARALRENCTVYIYSNFPMRSSTQWDNL